MAKSQESFMFTVGKLDAGMAILLGERAHLIEFPSLLLPPGATTGSIVNISVIQNHAEEKRRDQEFWNLQKGILDTYGTHTPEPPKLNLRNVTQTSVTLEWEPIQLATAKLRSLDIYRNRQRLAAIPSPLSNTSTKLSGLQLNSEYSFHLVLRTTAGTYSSNPITVRTHKLEDTSGIRVCFGNVQDNRLLEEAKAALTELGGKWSDRIQIDTTHFVCTTPAATPSGAEATGGVSNAPGVEYQKALQMSIPIVTPHWIMECRTQHKMVAIGNFYLGASPSTPISSAPFSRPQSMSQATLPSPANQNAQATRAASRQSLPPPARNATSPPTAQAASAPRVAPIEPTPEEPDSEGSEEEDGDVGGRARKGTMSKTFRFPSPSDEAPPPVPPVPASARAAPEGEHDAGGPPRQSGQGHRATDTEEVALTPVVPPTVEMPPPPPVEKERSPLGPDIGDEEVGDTEEISLN
ncbi:chitin synthase, class 5 [Phanerochaete sordida]|uniref:Chitin synthase, class 5 n=1 Tax=Phanerochaete sordida TaxID=48140 RepID=A0A9P3G307_9APHY|nr:chitin synthase, class 5 [Phanerochaete sordida]